MFVQKLMWGEGGTGYNNVLVFTFKRNWLRGEMSISESRVIRHNLYQDSKSTGPFNKTFHNAALVPENMAS